jgi:hypothetical protein
MADCVWHDPYGKKRRGEERRGEERRGEGSSDITCHENNSGFVAETITQIAHLLI